MSFGLEIVDIRDKLERVNNLFVVEKHARNLACALAIVLLDDWVDSITNLLSTSIWFSNLRKPCKINKRRVLLLLCLLLHHLLLLLRSHVLLRRHHHAWMWHGLCHILLLWHLALRSLIRDLLVETTSLVLVWFASTTAGLATSTLIVLLVTTLTFSLVSSTLTVLLVISVLTLWHLSSIWHLVLALWPIHHVEVFHEILLNLLETSLFPLSMQLGGTLPELNTQGSSTEGSRLIELLDSSLSSFDVFEENEILSIGGRWIEVFALA